MKLRFYIFIALCVCLASTAGISSLIPIYEPADLIRNRAKNHDVIFAGTTHQQPRILHFLSIMVPRLGEYGFTHIGLEIASDQQLPLDHFMKTGKRISDIQIFRGIDCPEYRELLDIIRKSGLTSVALDLPKSRWSGEFKRDQWMAKRIAETFKTAAGMKMLVIVGNLHTLKNVEWEIPTIKDRFIRGYLKAIRPTLRLYSIAQSINEPVETCDFTKRFGGVSDPVGIETQDFNRRLGLTQAIAVKAMTAHEAVDAVIVF